MMNPWCVGHWVHCDLWGFGRVVSGLGGRVDHHWSCCGEEGEGRNFEVGLMMR